MSIAEKYTMARYNKEGFIMAWLKKALGIRVVAMKCQALAEFLKVDFLFVPEHYRCVKRKRESK